MKRPIRNIIYQAKKLLGLKILDIYIIKKFLGTFFYSIALIISIAIIFDVAEKLDDFMEKEAPLYEIVFDYYLNFIPYFANLFSGMFTFIAVIFFTSKLASNTEIIAILSNGVSFNRFLYPYFISATVIAVFSFLLSAFIIPPANKVMYDFYDKYIKNKYRFENRNVHKQIEPGTFVYLQSYNNNTNVGYKFSIEKFEDGQLISKLISDYIKWDTTSNKWIIRNYYIRHIDGLNETIETGKSIDTTLNMLPKEFNRRWYHVETLNLPQLSEYIEEQKMQGDENIELYLIEKYNRYTYPFATFILTLIGVTISSRKSKGGIGLHIGLGLLLSFSYIIFMRFSTMFAIGGGFSILLAVWIPNIIFAIIGAILYKMAPK